MQNILFLKKKYVLLKVYGKSTICIIGDDLTVVLIGCDHFARKHVKKKALEKILSVIFTSLAK